ncbi:hypothetical protein ABK040_010004 [Willaertia magna]
MVDLKNGSPFWYQRLTTMSWKNTIKHANFGSLFLVSGVAMVGLVILNDIFVHKISSCMVNTARKRTPISEIVDRVVPEEKPEYIKRWEQTYGNEQSK